MVYEIFRKIFFLLPPLISKRELCFFCEWYTLIQARLEFKNDDCIYREENADRCEIVIVNK